MTVKDKIRDFPWKVSYIKTRKVSIKTADLVLLLLDAETIQNASKLLNIGRKTLERIVSQYIPELPKSPGRSIKFRILDLFNCTQCTECLEYLAKSSFTVDSSRVSGLSSMCKICASKCRKLYRKNNTEEVRGYEKKSRGKTSTKINRAKAEAMRRAKKLKATPIWFSELDEFALQESYELCLLREKETGLTHHVDHIIPLQGLEVCGLHYHKNWQVIPAKENLEKGNKLLEKYKNG